MPFRPLAAAVLCCSFLFALSASAHPPTAASAKTFIESIFQLYGTADQHGRGIENWNAYLDPSLNLLVKADETAAEAAHEVPGPLDADLICDCQEWDAIFAHQLDVRIDAKGRAILTASFDIYTPANRSKNDLRTMRYTLVPVNGNWRIYDIEDLSRPVEKGHSRSLRKEIELDILNYHQPSK